MKSCAASLVAGLALLLFAETSKAENGVPLQLSWQAPVNCPQEAQVRAKLRDMLGGSASDAAPSRLRAEGQIAAFGDRFRLTLNIHYDLVNGTRVVEARSCEDLGGVAAILLALLVRAEHSSSAPLTARDLSGGSSTAGAVARDGSKEDRDAGKENRDAGKENRDAGDAGKESRPATPPANEKPAAGERASASAESTATSLRFAFRVPELRFDVGALPEPSYGIGLALGVRHDAWRLLASGTLWLAQDYESGPFVGYGAHFGRLSGELSACRGWQVAGFELAPCLLLSLDDVSARGTGVGISSTNPRTAWVSVGAGVQGLWPLNRTLALMLGLNGRIATSRPQFVSESVGEIAQVGPAAFGVVLGCEWQL